MIGLDRYIYYLKMKKRRKKNRKVILILCNFIHFTQKLFLTTSLIFIIKTTSLILNLFHFKFKIKLYLILQS